MTAPRDDDTRARLAEVLDRYIGIGPMRAGAVRDLLPVVNRLTTERAAEALEAFVDGIYLGDGQRYADRARIVSEGLRRAAALRAASREETGR